MTSDFNDSKGTMSKPHARTRMFEETRALFCPATVSRVITANFDMADADEGRDRVEPANRCRGDIKTSLLTKWRHHGSLPVQRICVQRVEFHDFVDYRAVESLNLGQPTYWNADVPQADGEQGRAEIAQFIAIQRWNSLLKSPADQGAERR